MYVKLYVNNKTYLLPNYPVLSHHLEIEAHPEPLPINF